MYGLDFSNVIENAAEFLDFRKKDIIQQLDFSIECHTPRHDTKSHAYRANFHVQFQFQLSFALYLGMMSCLQLLHNDHAYSFVSCFHVMQPAFLQRSCLQRHDVMSSEALYNIMSCLHVIHP